MDRQNREGSKFGGGGVMSDGQAGRDRKERLRQLALETIDLNKDPYFMRNHLGTYECKLCLTLHNNEGNYLAHTQGKKHQSNLLRRASEDDRAKAASAEALSQASKRARYGGDGSAAAPRAMKIGRPAYSVAKSVDKAGAKCLSFEIAYSSIAEGVAPRYRFMSSFEQRVEAHDTRYQYLMFAAEPYDTIAFKIPNKQIDKREGRFVTSWVDKKFTVTLFFEPEAAKGGSDDE